MVVAPPGIGKKEQRGKEQRTKNIDRQAAL
jgi:hypothetical protein